MEENILTIEDRLQLEGIRYKGYGIIPKSVMTNTELSLESKAIYALFMSYSGAGNTSFPSVSKIQEYLGVQNQCYYKHFRPLKEKGYISCFQEKKGGIGNGFQRNIYTIKSEIVSDGKKTAVNSAGFGFIAKAPMLDDRLTIKAKGVYAYLCSFAGAGDFAFPSVDTILFHLDISKSAYHRYMKELKETGYIEIDRRCEKGKNLGNTYRIVEKPVTSHMEPEKEPEEKPRIQIQLTQNQTTQIQTTQNHTANINSTGTNSSEKNSVRRNPSVIRTSGTKTVSAKQMTDRSSFGHSFKETQARADDLVKGAEAQTPEELAAKNVLISSLAELLSMPCKVSGRQTTPEEMESLVMRCSDGGNLLVAERCITGFSDAIKKGGIKNKTGYMQKVLLNAMDEQIAMAPAAETFSKRDAAAEALERAHSIRAKYENLSPDLYNHFLNYITEDPNETYHYERFKKKFYEYAYGCGMTDEDIKAYTQAYFTIVNTKK